jgi:hypothetical protein
LGGAAQLLSLGIIHTMKKYLALFGVLLCTSFHCLSQETSQSLSSRKWVEDWVNSTNQPTAQEQALEQDFINRLIAFQKSGDMEQATNICEQGSPTILNEADDRLEQAIVRGIKSIKFRELLPFMKNSKGINLHGSIYVLNLKPDKLVIVEFQTTVTNGSSGFGLNTGIKDGRIMICGYKPKDN